MAVSPDGRSSNRQRRRAIAAVRRRAALESRPFRASRPLRHGHARPTYCAIDFGTSNSAVAVPDGAAAMRLVELEPGYATMPTAVFYSVEGAAAARRRRVRVRPRRDRRLRRRHRRPPDALDEEHPRQHAGRADDRRRRRPRRALPRRRRRLPAPPEGAAPRRAAGAPIERAVLGRPVFFVDDDPARDAQAAGARCAARRAQRRLSRDRVPVRADRRRVRLRAARSTREEMVLVADIGGGTSDFSLVRVGPRARRRASTARTTSSPTTASTSPAPTSTAASSSRAILPLFGYGALRPEHRRRAAARGAERGLLRPRDLAPDQHRLQPAARRRAARHARASTPTRRSTARLMTVVDRAPRPRPGRRAPRRAKIAVADGGATPIDLGARRARARRRARRARRARSALDADLDRIVAAARDDGRAGRASRPSAIDALYFTGGSTGLRPAGRAARGGVSGARASVRGDRFASVATGLGAASRSAPLRGRPTLTRR